MTERTTIDQSSLIQAEKNKETPFPLRANFERSPPMRHELYNLFMHAPAGVCIYRGPDLRIDFINPACEAFCGTKGLTGKSFDEAFPDLRNSVTRENHFRVYASGQIHKESAVPVTRDFGTGKEETKHFDMVLQPSFDLLGNIQGVDTYAFEVTELIKSQGRDCKLAEANRMLMSSLDYGQILKYVVQTAVDSFVDWCAIFLVDTVPDPKNARSSVLRACPVEYEARTPMLCTKLKDYLASHEELEDGITSVAKVLRTGERVLAHPIRQRLMSEVTDETESFRLQGLMPETVIAAPMKLSGQLYGVIVYGSMDPDRVFGNEDLQFAQKLTDQSTLAVSNAQLYCQLKTTVKARDELLSICSHELRTPLTSLKLHTDLTKKIFASGSPLAFSPERMKKFVELSDRQLDRLTRLIEEMLDFSRISGGRMHLNRETMDMADLLEEQVDRLTPQAIMAKCPLMITYSEHVIGNWDRFRIEQVFTNLIGNAMKYGAGCPISIRLSQTTTHVIVHVLDEGIGISQEDQQKIFRPYERVSHTTNIGGLGLGLYISEQVITAHGGTIRVESAPGRGSDFIVEIPKCLEEGILH